MDQMRQYIKTSQATILERKENIFFNSIVVYIKDPLPEEVSLTNVLNRIEKSLPKHLVSNVEAIYVGDFELFKEKEINAAYEDGAIYISNTQDNEDDLIDDVIHEIAHAVEDQFGMEVYADGDLEREFLYKRQKLLEILDAHGYELEKSYFFDTEYNEEFDDYLYKQVGYDKLIFFTMDLFPSNYSATSLREYFAVGFEKFFLGESREIHKISPVLYKKIHLVSHLDG